MKISALEELRSSDLLGRNFKLYHDLSVVLEDRIAQLKTSKDFDPACKETLEALKAQQRALQTVLELEASLVKRSRSTETGGCDLDLDAARVEILSRLAVWTEQRRS